MIDFFNMRGRKGLFGNKVCILGPHISVLDAIPNIDPDAYIISLNCAVMIPGVDVDLMLVADKAGPSLGWFGGGLMKKEMLRMYSLDVVKEIEPSVRVDITFQQKTALTTSDAKPVFGELRYNATVFAQALQACHWACVREVDVQGVKFEGDEYYDGTKAGYKPNHWRTQRNIVNKLIEYLIAAEGMIISGSLFDEYDVEKDRLRKAITRPKEG